MKTTPRMGLLFEFLDKGLVQVERHFTDSVKRKKVETEVQSFLSALTNASQQLGALSEAAYNEFSIALKSNDPMIEAYVDCMTWKQFGRLMADACYQAREVTYFQQDEDRFDAIAGFAENIIQADCVGRGIGVAINYNYFPYSPACLIDKMKVAASISDLQKRLGITKNSVLDPKIGLVHNG